MYIEYVHIVSTGHRMNMVKIYSPSRLACGSEGGFVIWGEMSNLTMLEEMLDGECKSQNAPRNQSISTRDEKKHPDCAGQAWAVELLRRIPIQERPPIGWMTRIKCRRIQVAIRF